MIFAAAISYFASFLFVQVLLFQMIFCGFILFQSETTALYGLTSTCDALTQFPFS